MKKNNRGFSYVELIIVLGMLTALVTVVAGGMSVAWGARASKAANSVDSLLSQCKVNALSGEDNYIQIIYAEKDSAERYTADGYYAELYRDGSSEPYKSDNIANNRIHISFQDEEIGTENAIQIKFNQETGAVEYARSVPGSGPTSTATDATPDEIHIGFQFGRPYTITLYKLTGEHQVS